MRRWLLVLSLAFPISAAADPSIPVYPSTSTNTYNYWEDFDAGRTVTATANFQLQGSFGQAWAAGATSTAEDLLQGYYFSVFRDLLPPGPVQDTQVFPQANGDIKLTWDPSLVQDPENQVWGFRIYRSFFYGRTEYQTLVVDAESNTFSPCTDTSELLSGIDYAYEVHAVDTAFNERMLDNRRVGLVHVNLQPHSLTTTAAVSVPGGDIDLTWGAIGGASDYRIYRSLTVGARGDFLYHQTAPATAYLDLKTNGLVGGRRYFYVVQAVVSGVEEQRGNNQASALSDQGVPNLPLIYSDTHPDPSQAYANPNPHFLWRASSDPGRSFKVAGYYLKLDASGITGTAVAGPGWTYANVLERAYTQVGNGRWYFHCRPNDVADNLGEEAVFTVRILATGRIQGVAYEGVGVVSADLLVEAWKDGLKQSSTHTQVNGQYALDPLGFGTYTLRFSRFGYKPMESTGHVLDLTHSPLVIDLTFVAAGVVAPGKAAAYPNPASGSEVRFVYTCPGACQVTIDILNLLGQPVGRILENKPSGYQFSSWPLTSVARGVYLYRVTLILADGSQQVLGTKKFAVIK